MNLRNYPMLHFDTNSSKGTALLFIVWIIQDSVLFMVQLRQISLYLQLMLYNLVFLLKDHHHCLDFFFFLSMLNLQICKSKKQQNRSTFIYIYLFIRSIKVHRHHQNNTIVGVMVVSVSQHYKNPTKCVGLVQSGPHHHFIEN